MNKDKLENKKFRLRIDLFATKKSGGNCAQRQDSHSKRLGVKKSHYQAIKVGQIIVRQRGTHFLPGKNVGLGRDHTIFAMIEGYVKFSTRNKRKLVSVIPNIN